jgi:hypothetical protein
MRYSEFFERDRTQNRIPLLLIALCVKRDIDQIGRRKIVVSQKDPRGPSAAGIFAGAVTTGLISRPSP